jgi:hypothetical protein
MVPDICIYMHLSVAILAQAMCSFVSFPFPALFSALEIFNKAVFFSLLKEQVSQLKLSIQSLSMDIRDWGVEYNSLCTLQI